MSTDAARQPKGVPVGGQFAPTEHPESGVALAATPEWESWPEVVDVRAALAETLGCDPALVRTTADTSRRCGSPDGSSWVVVSATIPGDPLNQEVSIGFERGAEGGTSDMRCEVGWDCDPLPTLDYVRDSTTTPYRPSRDASVGALTQAVGDTLDQARVQRSLNTNVNDQQHRARIADEHRNGRYWYDIFSMTSEVTSGQLTVIVEDHQSGRGGKKLRLDVARDGTVTGATIDTDFGLVTVNGSDLDRVCERVDFELACAQDRFSDIAGAARGRLEDRFAAVLA